MEDLYKRVDLAGAVQARQARRDRRRRSCPTTGRRTSASTWQGRGAAGERRVRQADLRLQEGPVDRAARPRQHVYRLHRPARASGTAGTTTASRRTRTTTSSSRPSTATFKPGRAARPSRPQGQRPLVQGRVGRGVHLQRPRHRLRPGDQGDRRPAVPRPRKARSSPAG